MAEELKTVLGFDASQAISTLAKLDAQLVGYTSSMIAAAGGTTTFNSAAKGVDASLGQLANAQHGVVSSQNSLIVSNAKVRKGVKDTGKVVEDTAGKTKKASKSMLLSWQAVARIFAIQVIHQVISKITSALGSSIGEAQNLEIALAEIQTISGPLRNNFESLADAVHELSNEFGASREIVAEGIYQTLSNQIADGTDAFTFFAASSELAVGGVMSADAAVNLLSSTINAYGYNASQASTISGKLFKTIELGRVRGEEFANTYGRVLVVAAQLGVSFDEVSASVATLTISGLKYNEAATLITNTMLKLIRPTDALKKVMKAMGVSSAEAGIQAFGFQGFLVKLREAAGGTAEALGEVFGRVRAIRGVMGLTGEATEKYQKNLEAIEKAGSGDIFKAKELIFKTNAKKVQIHINELKNAIVFGFGRTAIDKLNKVFDAFGGAVNIIKGLTVAITTAAIGMTLLAATAFPIPATILAIAAAAGVVAARIAKETETASAQLERLRNQQKKNIEETNKEEAELTELRIRKLNKQLGALQRFNIERTAAVNKTMENAKVKEEFLSNVLDQQLDKRTDAWTTFVDALEEKIVESAENIADSQKKIFDIQREISRADFDLSIKGADALRKSTEANKRAGELIREAGRAFRQGKTDQTDSLLQEAKAMAKISIASGEAAKNSGAEHRARKTLTAVFNTQIKLQEKYQDNQRIIARVAQAEHGKEAARADRVKAILAKMQEIKIVDPATGKYLFGTPEQIKAELDGLHTALEAEFAAAGKKADLFAGLGLTDQLKAAVGLFENLINKEPVQLRFAFDQYIDETFRDLVAWFAANKVPEEVLEITELLGIDQSNIVGLQQASKILIDTGKEQRAAERTIAGTEGNQLQLNNALKAGRRHAFNFVQETIDAKKAIKATLADASGSISGIKLQKSQIKEFTEQLAALKDVTQITGDVMERLSESIEGGFDSEKYGYAITQLDIYAGKLEKVSLLDVAKPIRAMLKEMKSAATLAAGAGISDVLIKDRNTVREVLKGTLDAVGPHLRDKAVEGATGVEAAGEREKAVAKDVAAEWRVTAVVIAGAGKSMGSIGTIRPVGSGPTQKRAAGGFAPQGTDTIPAMLTPGESVINADSTRKFFSQIVAMNAGKMPVYRDTGGTVTNVGDVNITVSGADSPKQTARETMAAFRREMRRHTSTF